MLGKASGIRYLVALINKMDDPTANQDQTRYDGIKDKISSYLEEYDFKPDEDTFCMPSGETSFYMKKIRKIKRF